MASSRFIQLTNEVLIEYIYSSPISPTNLNYNFTRIVNKHVDGIVQLMNVDSAIDDTGNVQERCSIQTTQGKFVDTDKDQVPTFLTYDQSLGNITTSTIVGSNTPYDTVKVHLVSGYNFEDKDGLIIQVLATERSGKQMQLANITFLKDADFFEFNPRPIWLGDRLYDRYFEFKIPSISLINNTYYSLEGHPGQSSTLVAQITSDGQGFLRAAPLNITAIDIASTSVQTVGGARYNNYLAGASKTVALNQSDEFALLSAVVQPSATGDFFEYFASWAGGFIEDFLLNANTLPGNNYIVLHEIRVFEQVGSSFLQTDSIQMIQEDSFDQPRRFRPILLNADRAVSFTLEYTSRLYNKANSSQIIRTANYTSYSPKSWGKYIQPLKLLNEPEPYMIYNKVVAGPTFNNEAFINTVADVSPFSTKYIPSFFDRFTIGVQNDNVILDKDGKLVANQSSSTTTVFGQGDCNIIINPFDNFFKFTIIQLDAANNPLPLDLGSSATYYMVFIDNSNKKTRFPATVDATLADPTKGDVLFKIPEADAEKIVSFTTQEFYIVSRFETGVETQIYQGVFNKPIDIQTVKAVNSQVQTSQTSTVETKIQEIATKQADIIAQTNSIKTSAPLEQAVSIAAQVEIPGASTSTPSTLKNSIIANIVPASQQKKSTATIATEANIKAQSDASKADI